jgi:hypothetical protein
MQNANEFTHDKNCYDYPQLRKTSVELNEQFSVAVALQFLAERFPDTPITLVATVSAGYNDYQILNIPAEHLDHFIGHSEFDEFDDTENHFITIDNDVYALYTDFAELSHHLETKIDVDTFYNYYN